MSSPRIKIFDAHGQYQASTHDHAAAGALMGLYGEGATVRLGHSKRDIIWTEGEDGDAYECYDLIADAIAAHDQKVDEALEAMAEALGRPLS